MNAIQFFTLAPVTQRNGKVESALASARYRVIMPALQLSRLGYRINIGQIPPDATVVPDPATIAADVVVFSKTRGMANEKLAKALRNKGKRVVVDICDNYFDPALTSDYRDYAIAMCKRASSVITSTPRLAELVREYAGVEATVVTDPVEGSRGAARFSPTFPRAKLLWFGHPNNWDGLARVLPSLGELGRELPLALTLITMPIDSIRNTIAAHNAAHGSHCPVTLKAWDNDAVWPALADCDMVVIPSGNTDFHAAKSPNRIAESLWAGRHVVANPLPSYEPFRDFAWLGDDIAAGVRAALLSPAGIEARIANGQAWVAAQHSPWVVGRQWESALAGGQAARPLRLNLGCGDKILPGYVNVDVVESRAGMKPDVLCDLHRLSPFADNSADEILSVHVVEHFWRWEVRDILREWVRVLKPGARMVLECPNLESACRHFLENPELHGREDQHGQRSMWVFYGDPAWKDPYMIHRWGYTPQSLATLMQEAGLVDIRQEPAQFKLREPRDMRVTGIKPS